LSYPKKIILSKKTQTLPRWQGQHPIGGKSGILLTASSGAVTVNQAFIKTSQIMKVGAWREGRMRPAFTTWWKYISNGIMDSGRYRRSNREGRLRASSERKLNSRRGGPLGIGGPGAR